MALSASIKAILKRISKELSPDADTTDPALSDEAALARVLQCIDETVLPRTLVMDLGGPSRLVAQVADRKLIHAALFDKETSQDVLDMSLADPQANIEATFAWMLTDFTSAGGHFEVITDHRASDFDVSGDGVSVEALREACMMLKAPPKKSTASDKSESDATQPEKAAAPKKPAARKKEPAKKRAPAKKAKPSKAPKAATKPGKGLLDTLTVFNDFADTAFILSPTGQLVEGKEDTARPIAKDIGKTLSQDMAAWQTATETSLGSGALIVLRPEGLEDICLCVVPEDGFVLVALVKNRNLSRVFAFARAEAGSGGTS